MKNTITLILFFALSVLGVQAQVPSCAGEQGKLKWYYYENINGGDLHDLYSNHNFPLSPNGYEELTNLATPRSYNDAYGSMVKGYIKAPATGSYTFNVTGDNDVDLFLSTSAEPTDTQRIVHLTKSVYYNEHYVYPEQTSAPISLNQDQYYYFEVHHKENSGRDYFEIFWKAPNATDTSFQLINNTVLYDYTCGTTCPLQGQTCDDGNPNTVNDMTDGACNCLGTPISPDSCLGTRGVIQAMYWDSIPGNDIYDLQSAPGYPYEPDRVERLTNFEGPIYNYDEYGTRIRAMIIPPVTGEYTFNVTGDDDTWLYLSTSANFDFATVIAEVPGFTSDRQHDKYVSQTSAPINLTAGQIYYIELNHKEGCCGDHFAIFWKTPFHPDGNWKLLDGIYAFDYTCDLPCFPQGTVCDDGDPNTYNDAYDDNCNCSGIPCQTGDCDAQGNLMRFPSYEECAPTDKHSNNPNTAWLSCQTAPSPNAIRGSGHWIQYDFGRIETLGATHIWNYNVEDETSKGFREVVIDYSMDGTTWTELGQFTWNQANGMNDYLGFNGPDFGGITARYVLITALNNFDGNICMGFSKINFETQFCASENTLCQINGKDGVYDNNCDCRPLDTPFNACVEDEYITVSSAISTGNYSAVQRIESRATIGTNEIVNFVAGEEIQLLPGFEALNGSDFHAMIESCSPAGADEEDLENTFAVVDDKVEKNASAQLLLDTDLAIDLALYPSPTNTWTTINFKLPKTEKVHLSIRNTSGQLVRTIINNQNFQEGLHQKRFPAQTMAIGMYFVVLKTEATVVTKSLIVMESV